VENGVLVVLGVILIMVGVPLIYLGIRMAAFGITGLLMLWDRWKEFRSEQRRAR